MKQQRLNLCLLFLIGFCGLVLCSPFALMRAAETPTPSGTPVAQSAARNLTNANSKANAHARAS